VKHPTEASKMANKPSQRVAAVVFTAAILVIGWFTVQTIITMHQVLSTFRDVE
jgi:uncharacterized membrane protein